MKEISCGLRLRMQTETKIGARRNSPAKENVERNAAFAEMDGVAPCTTRGKLALAG